MKLTKLSKFTYLRVKLQSRIDENSCRGIMWVELRNDSNTVYAD